MLKNGQRVTIKENAGLPPHLNKGVVVGMMLTPFPVCGAFYAVDVGGIISKEYPYQVVGVWEVAMEICE